MKKILRALLERILHLDFLGLDGKKKYIGILLYLAHKLIPGFPQIDIEAGLSLDEVAMIWGLVSDAYKVALEKVKK